MVNNTIIITATTADTISKINTMTTAAAVAPAPVPPVGVPVVLTDGPVVLMEGDCVLAEDNVVTKVGGISGNGTAWNREITDIINAYHYISMLVVLWATVYMYVH